MEFLRSSKRRSLLSEIIYVVLNLGLVVVVLGLILIIESPWPAIAAVLLSKWRVFAVRPRYWLAHLQANLVDIIVSVSLATLMFIASGALASQLLLAVLYGVWLLVIKPRSKRTFMALQAGAAIFLGVSVVMAVSYAWPSAIVVAAMWGIGYAACRHVLISYEEAHQSFYSLVGGFLFAELGWIFYHWTFAYVIPGSNLAISQAAIVCTALGFLAYKAYDSFYHHQTIRSNDILLPLLLSSSVIIVLLLAFNRVGQGAL